MLEAIRNYPFLVAILAGACAQFIKVISFLVVEKKLNYKRLVQADGAPNMHSTTFSALSVAVGLKDGFSSLPFALAICLTAIILVDTMKVKSATSRQAEAVMMLLGRFRKRQTKSGLPIYHQLSFTPFDVFTGTGFGVLFALVVA